MTIHKTVFGQLKTMYFIRKKSNGVKMRRLYKLNPTEYISALFKMRDEGVINQRNVNANLEFVQS